MRIFKIQTVTPPYLQLAVDLPDLNSVQSLFNKLDYPISPQLILEIGSPLIKNEKLVDTVQVFKEFAPNTYLVADFKTLTSGRLEAEIAAKTGVDGAVISAIAPFKEINDFFHACRKNEIDSWLDALETPHDKLWAILRLQESPTGVIIRSDPTESIDHQRVSWMVMTQIKKTKLTSRILTGAAGNLTLETAPEVRRYGADIVIIGKAIHQAADPQREISRFLFSIKTNEWDYTE
ncbi:MAG: orotidine 5'-phosphate decarboxylase / HUMPS family protein [Candidatus Thorarchaeota archaeon]